MRRITTILIWALLVNLLLNIIKTPEACAESGSTGWSTPQPIVQTTGTINDIVSLGDGAGVLHVFFTYLPTVGSVVSIEYVKLMPDGWTEPNSIALEEKRLSGQSLRVVVDAENVLHLIWVDDGQVYHASALAAEAESAHAWSESNFVIQASTADIVVDGNGSLVIVGANADSSSLVFVRSSDGGATWTTGQVVALCARGSIPAYPRLARDGVGRLHLVWTEGAYPQWEPLTGVYYTRSLDDGATWEPPRQVDDSRHGEIGVAAVGENEVHLVWRSNVGGDGTFHQWSADGGATWSVLDQLDDNGGMSGTPSFVVDTVGTLHWALGAVKYASWESSGLVGYKDVATESVRSISNTSVERGAIAITGGNRLYVLFEVDFYDIWYTTRLLDVPAQTPVAQSTPTATATVARTLTAQTAPTEAWLAEDTSSNSTEQSIESTSARGLVRGAIAGAIVVVVVLAISLYRRRG